MNVPADRLLKIKVINPFGGASEFTIKDAGGNLFETIDSDVNSGGWSDAFSLNAGDQTKTDVDAGIKNTGNNRRTPQLIGSNRFF